MSIGKIAKESKTLEYLVMNGHPPGKLGLKRFPVALSVPLGKRQTPPKPATPSSPDEYKTEVPRSPSFAYSVH